MKKIGLLSLALVASISYANDRYYNEAPYDNGYTNQSNMVEHVRVVQSNPVYDNIVERNPYEQCRNVNVPIQSSGESEDLGTFLGGVAGGILGHQVGGGHGKTVATIGGAILGSAVGNSLSRKDSYARYETRRQCETKYHETNKRVLAGYNNIGYYKGQKIIKFSNTRLRTIPITINISY